MFDKDKYSTITLNDAEGGEKDVYVLCQTTIGGANYLVVTDDDPDEDEVEVTILKENEEGSDEENTQYDVVDDEDEATSLLEVFKQLMEVQEDEDSPYADGRWT